MSCFFVGTEFCSGVFINLGSGSFVAQWEVEPPWCPAGANRKRKVPIRSGQGRGWAAYHIDELDESQAKGHLDLLGHVLHGSDQLVVASEQVSHQPLLVPRAHPCNTKSQAATKIFFFKLPPCAFHLFSGHGGRILTRKQRAQTTHWFCYNCSSPHQVLLGVMNATNGATKSTKCDTRWSFTCSNAPWSGPTSQNKNVYFQALPST